MKFRNSIAAFIWGFSFLFLVMCVLFTYLLIRDGASHIPIYPPDIPDFYPPWVMPLVVAVFWLAGIGLAAYAGSKPCVSAEVQADKSVIVTHRYPLRKSVRHIPAARLEPARVIATTDSEGDPYFECQITASDGFTASIAEGHDRGRCESVCASFNDATGKKPEAATRQTEEA